MRLTSRFNKVAAVFAALVVIIIGYILFTTQAAVNYGSLESEGGTLSSTGATVGTDTAASGGKYVQLSTTTTTSGGGVTQRFPGDPNPLKSGKAYFGASNDNIPSYESAAGGKSVAIFRKFYSTWGSTQANDLKSLITSNYNANRIVWASFKTDKWATVASGASDGTLDNILKTVDSANHPVWLTFWHEAENDEGASNTGTAADYVAMQKHIRARMTALGTKNIALAPIYMCFWVNKDGPAKHDRWWPGQGVFDFYGFDCYQDSPGNPLLSTKYNTTIKDAEAKNMPYALGEYGVKADEPSNVTDFWNAQWSPTVRDRVGISYWDTSDKALSLYPNTKNAFINILKSDTRIMRVQSLGSSTSTTTKGTDTATVSVPVAGSYKVWSRVQVPNATNNSYDLQIDSGTTTTVSTATTGSWQWVAAPTSLSLSAGNHTVKLTANGNNVKVDRIMFLSDATCTPTGTGTNCESSSSDTTNPVVSVTAPTPGSTVSGNVTLSASASDNVGVTKVEFYVDGSLKSSDSAAPYSYSWDSSSIANGTYGVTAKAYDAAGNSATSTSVSITVKNGDAQSPTTPTGLKTTGQSTSSVDLTWNTSTDNVGVKGYKVYRDGVQVATVPSPTTGGTTTGGTVPQRFPGDPNPLVSGRAFFGASNNNFASHEAAAGKSVAIRRMFYQWGTSPATKLASDIKTNAAADRLTWGSFKTPPWAEVASGKDDAVLDQMLKTVDGAGKPTWLTFWHEPEGEVGDANAGSAADFVAMQKHIRARMTALGTKNIAFAPILTAFHVGGTSSGLIDPNTMYAANTWDFFGFDTYQTDASSTPYDARFKRVVDFAVSKNLPFAIGEWGNRDNDATSAQEMVNFFHWGFDNNKDLLGMSYFDSDANSSSGGWTLSGANLNQFIAILKSDPRVARLSNLGTSLSSNTGGGTAATTVSFTDTGLNDGTAYSYRVSAYDANGNESVQSTAISASTKAAPDTTPPTAPTGLASNNVTYNSVGLSWNAATDKVGVTAYVVQRNGVTVAQTSDLNYTDTSVSANTSYTYTVLARDAAGNVSGPSNSVSVKTPNPPDTTPPTKPSNVIATAISSTQVNLTWTASTDNVGVTAYNVMRDGQLIGTVNADQPGSSTQFGDATVEAGTSYSYVVTASDAAGNTSQASTAAQVTTPADTTVSEKQGVWAEYYANKDLGGTPVVSQQENNINYNWGKNAPLTNVPADNYSVAWSGRIVAPSTGTYKLYTNADDGVRLYIDDTLVIDDWTTHSKKENSATVSFTAGKKYNFRLEYFEKNGSSNVSLSWSGPGLAKQVIPASSLQPQEYGLTGTYFSDSNLSSVSFTRVDPNVNFNWGSGSPSGSLLADNFSVRWSGQVYIPKTDTYTFYSTSDDGVRLLVDDQQVFKNWNDHTAKEVSGSIQLTGGQKHNVVLEYYEAKGSASVNLQWSSSTITKQVIDRESLRNRW
jgi:chitodextrinase